MTKSELLQHIETLPNDAEITFAVFDIDGRMNFVTIEPSAQVQNDPTDVIAFCVNRFVPPTKTAKELSRL